VTNDSNMQRQGDGGVGEVGKPGTDQVPSISRAKLALGGIVGNSITMSKYVEGIFDRTDSFDAYRAIESLTAAVKAGDMSHAESLLLAQALTLDSVFGDLARRARTVMSSDIDRAEQLLRLALRAQAQSRATLDTLIAAKSPPVVYAHQANVAQGNQLVNTGTLVTVGASNPQSTMGAAHQQPLCAITPPNKLLEGSSDAIMLDARAPGQAVSGDKGLAPVGSFHRAAQRGRKGGKCQERVPRG
jgi:hypothetical protein